MFLLGNDNSYECTYGLAFHPGGRSLPSLLGHVGQVGALSFSADRRLLASGSNDGVIKLWDYPAREERKEWNYKRPVWAVAVSPDGRTLAVAGRWTIDLSDTES